MTIDFLTDPDKWFEQANEIKSTDDLLHYIKTTFSDKNLTLDFMKSAGVMDMLFILSDHLVAEKRFNDYIDLRNILKKENKIIYKKEFIYFDSTILRYALFIGNDALAKDAFKQFEKDPDRDIDVYLPNLRLIALYGKGEWVEEICSKNYDTINNGSYYGEPALELAKYVLFHRTEVEYLKFKENGTFDSDAYFKRLERFQFNEFEEKNKEDLVNALINPIADASILKKELEVEEFYTLRILGNSFMRYAYEEKKMPFIVSGIVWELMSDYWFEKDNKKKLFHLDEKSFDKRAMSLRGFFNNYFCNTIALVLGGSYVYDFLYQIGLITEIEHKKAIKDIERLIVATQHLGSRLWKNGFFQNWQIADSIDLLQFQTLIENADISFNKVEEFEYKSHDEHYGLDNLDEKITKAVENRIKTAHTNYVPVRTEPKIGRNDPCTCGSGKKYKKCCGA